MNRKRRFKKRTSQGILVRITKRPPRLLQPLHSRQSHLINDGSSEQDSSHLKELFSPRQRSCFRPLLLILRLLLLVAPLLLLRRRLKICLERCVTPLLLCLFSQRLAGICLERCVVRMLGRRWCWHGFTLLALSLKSSRRKLSTETLMSVIASMELERKSMNGIVNRKGIDFSL